MPAGCRRFRELRLRLRPREDVPKKRIAKTALEELVKSAMASVGEQLRAAREKQGLSLSEVVERTKLRTDHVVALEEGDYDVVAAPVYVRGFVRSYAAL